MALVVRQIEGGCHGVAECFAILAVVGGAGLVERSRLRPAGCTRVPRQPPHQLGSFLNDPQGNMKGFLGCIALGERECPPYRRDRPDNGTGPAPLPSSPSAPPRIRDRSRVR